MKRTSVTICTLLSFLLLATAVIGADPEPPTTPPDTKNDFFNMAGSAILGGVIIDGINYQQIGARFEFNIYKIGLGLDIQILLDENGNIRKKDWDNWEAYLDKIYFVSWAKKGDPFYVKYGGLEYTYLGYNIAVDGYSNMIEYPAYKRQGLELAFDSKFLGGEFMVNDIKEMWHGKKPSVLMGGRLYYKIISDLAVGVSLAGDLNEYKGLRDSDGDGYPDEMDWYPNNSNWVTEKERYLAALGGDTTAVQNLIDAGLIDGTDVNNLTPYSNKTSRTGIWSTDIGFPIIKGKTVKWDVYSEFAQIFNTGGYGFTLPGTRLKIGPVTFTAEYKHSSDKFLFGYYNKTYELERAVIIDDGAGNFSVATKLDTLDSIKGMDGFLAGIKFNIFDLLEASLKYQALFQEDDQNALTSINGEIELKKKLIPKVSTARAFYTMNNVENLENWKTPGTIMGATIGFEFISGTSLNLNYLITFQDKDGNGTIKGSEETITQITITATSQLN